MSARGPSRDTAGRILDVAERLAQTRGFNGFSYADIATELDVTKASLHYHFATKAVLGRALIARYHEVFARLLREIDEGVTSAVEKLRRYVTLYRGVLADERMCLCGMVAAEHATLPKAMQEEIRRFFTANEVWLAAVLEEGERDGELRLRGAALDVARLLLSALQGAMLVARSYRSVARFDVSAKQLLADLAAEPASTSLLLGRGGRLGDGRRARAGGRRSGRDE
jgi:TetR/AcrR family transcriptional regulator, transcriptional repressor for nem operon